MIDLLKETNGMLHVNTAGAGATFVQSIWGTPGISSVFAGASLPYHQVELETCLGHAQDGSAVTEDVSYDLAIDAFLKAAATSTVNPVGVGITAAVAKERIPRGELRAYVTVIARAGVASSGEVALERGKGADLRAEHDKKIAWAATGLVTHVLSGGALNDSQQEARAKDRILAYPVFTAHGREVFKRPSPREDGGGYRLYLPASLNPMHDGHRQLMTLASRAHGKNGCYLVESDPPHKEAPSAAELLLKVAVARADGCPIEFTRGEPLFIDKARARPRASFAIGVDTMIRMLQPQWGPEPMEMLEEMASLGVGFAVMPRRLHDGNVYRAADIQVPSGFQSLFVGLASDPVDISSTQIRKGA